jgi:PKD repeat protein
MKNQNANMLRITSIFLVILLFGLMSASITHAETYSFVTKWGSQGSGTGQLYAPGLLSLDSSGNIYVADINNLRIQEFNSNGAYINQFGMSYGSKNGSLSYPHSAAVDRSGNVYVADTGNYRIQKFDSEGNYITQWGSKSIGDGKVFVPYGIAIDSSSNVYVSDTDGDRIVKFNSNGRYITQWGYSGRSNKQFYDPKGIAIDSSGNVYVADTSNHRIQKFDSNGNYLMLFGATGADSGQLVYPRGVAVDSSGNIYVADTDNNRIQKFDKSGNYITQWGSRGSGDGQFMLPIGVTVDSSGNVYVSDTGNNRIQKFATTKPVLPVANFISNVTSGYTPLSVAFTDKSTNFPTSWKWNFGDGTNSTFQNPVHVYSKTGNYIVNLTVSNANGTNSKLGPINVSLKPGPILPVANFSSNVTKGYPPLSVQFTDLSKNATSRKWNFGDGTNSTLQNPVHVYSKTGNYIVNLTVSNANGTNSKLGPINVSAVPPICNTSTIYGYSFTDSNKNKIMDTGEVALSNMTININGYDTCKGTLVSTTTKTNSTGYFAFNGVDPGVYVVSESFVIGWLPTTDASYTLTVPSNSTKIRKDFGNSKFVK